MAAEQADHARHVFGVELGELIPVSESDGQHGSLALQVSIRGGLRWHVAPLCAVAVCKQCDKSTDKPLKTIEVGCQTAGLFPATEAGLPATIAQPV
jgi:hypothetical protein